MDDREKRAVETLSFDCMVDIYRLFGFMDHLFAGTGYRWSLPGSVSCSRSAADQLKLYQKGRAPYARHEGKPAFIDSDGAKLYTRRQLKVVSRGKIVTGRDGFERLSNHQAPDPLFAAQFPMQRGEGRACDQGVRRVSDGRFFYYGKMTGRARELYDAAHAWLAEHGWKCGRELWSWDENHWQKP